MALRHLTHRINDVFTRLDGLKARGFLTTASNASTKDKAPYRVFLANKPVRVKVGDVLKTPGGEYFMLLQHPSDRPDTQSFKAQSITDILTWKRPVKTLDPVTNFPKDANTLTDLGWVYATLEIPESVGLEKMQDTRYRFLTGADVRVDDLVDGKIVKRIVQVLGVKLVQVS